MGRWGSLRVSRGLRPASAPGEPCHLSVQEAGEGTEVWIQLRQFLGGWPWASYFISLGQFHYLHKNDHNEQALRPHGLPRPAALHGGSRPVALGPGLPFCHFGSYSKDGETEARGE